MVSVSDKQISLSNLAAVLPLSGKLADLLQHRMVLTSKMVGYPRANLVIGTLQNMIDLTSPATILQSFIILKDLSHLTAGVLSAAQGAQMDKFQLNRSEIRASILEALRTQNRPIISDEHLELVSDLIVSYGADPTSWTLQGGRDSDSMHIQFARLYRDVLMDIENSELPIYNPVNRSVVSFGEYFNQMNPNMQANLYEEALSNAATLYRFSLCRIIDHVYQLLMDKEIWYTFVTPRKTSTLGSNLERAKGLKLFGLYLHHLLNYHIFFQLECFVKSYELVQEWIVEFRPLTDTAKHELEHSIRQYDLLGAKEDVHQLISSFGQTATLESLNSKALIFPSEFLLQFDIATHVAQAEVAADRYSLDDQVNNLLEVLDTQASFYLPLTSGYPISDFDVTGDLSQLILMHRIVEGRITEALTNVARAMSGANSRDLYDSFRPLGITAKIPFEIPHALEWRPLKGSVQGVVSKKLTYDAATPVVSHELFEFLRERYKFRIFTTRQPALNYQYYRLPYMIDYDKANYLRELVPVGTKSLVPSFWSNGETVYDVNSVAASLSSVKRFCELLSGKNYEIFIREMHVPHLAKAFATQISSFALLYSLGQGERLTLNSTLRGIADYAGLTHIVGIGDPYGLSYSQLNGMQGRTAESYANLINLGEGFYIRFLTNIPVPTSVLAHNTSFYKDYCVPFFVADGTTASYQRVERWVLSESMLNFCLIPSITSARIPNVMMTPYKTYLNSDLMFNMQIFYQAKTTSENRQVLSLDLRELEWPWDKVALHTKFITFPDYHSASPNVDVESPSELAKIQSTIENMKDKAEKEQKAVDNNLEGSLKHATKAVENEIEDGRREFGPGDDQGKPMDL